MSYSDSGDSDGCIFVYSSINQVNKGEETEIFEENNNDPNNNCEDVEFIEELANNEMDDIEPSSEVPPLNYRTDVISPQPGCSKDFTDSITSYVVQYEAMLIYNLLPKFGYSAIYNNLYQNRHAMNRIELAVWDLLPNKRPDPQFSSKRKSEHNTYTSYMKKLSNEASQVRIFQDPQEALCSNKTMNQQEQQVFNTMNDLLSPGKAYATLNTAAKLNGILQPPKLILGTSRSVSASTPTTKKRPILAPSKFTCTTFEDDPHKSVKKLKSCDNKIETSNSCYNNIQSTSASNFLPERADVKKSIEEEYVNNIKEDKDIEVTEDMLPLTEYIPASTKNERVSSDLNQNQITNKDFGECSNTHKNNTPKDTTENVIYENSSNSDSMSEGEETIKDSPEDTVANSHSRQSNILAQLTAMFPHIDPDYVETICKDLHVGNQNILKKDNQYKELYSLIEHLLTHGKNYPAKLRGMIEVEDINPILNEQYTNLLGIFPNADPSYLREIAEKFYNKPDSLREFVQLKLENHDYPTREQYIARRKITEQQKQYTTDFDMKQFLKIFPDPINYFEDLERKTIFKPVAFEFLKYWCPKHKVDTIMAVFAQFKYNLAFTIKALEFVPFDRTGSRHTRLLPTEDIPLLQEMAFITHKAEITAYLNMVKDQEADKFKELKDKGELLKCECCFDDECMPSKCSQCQNNHIFCNSCIRSGAESKMGDGDTSISCFINCGAEFSLSVLQRVLLPTQFSILLQKRQEAEVIAAGLDGLVSCPFCHFASIPPREDKIFKCFNPDCMKESCRLCKKSNHLPLKCDEAVNEKARHYLEEKMTAALVRTCYKCKKPFFKEEGCNMMKCACGAIMCYICNKPISGYSHYSGTSSTLNKCPLESDNNKINVQSVVKAARAVEKEIRKQNPNVKLNTKALLRQLPYAKLKNP